MANKDIRTQKRKEALKEIRRKIKTQKFIESKHKICKYDRDFPYDNNDIWHRKAVCKRCHCVLNDCEPSTFHGEFWHPSKDKEGKPHWCKNAGKRFSTQDIELEPFLKKSIRRYNKRNNIRP